jgi:hypothetical protein
MMQTMVNTDELYALIKRAVREVIHEEIDEFWQKAMPFVSPAEMQDILEQYGMPSPNKEVAYSEVITV